MKKSLSTQVTINASPEKIWKILTEIEKYPIWNPFITSLAGNLAVGSKIKAQIQPPGKSSMTFNPKILILKPLREFTWLGHFMVPGIFDGEHSFRIIDNRNGSCLFIQSENFKGILVPFLKKMINVTTKAGFESMNDAIKLQAENS